MMRMRTHFSPLHRGCRVGRHPGLLVVFGLLATGALCRCFMHHVHGDRSEWRERRATWLRDHMAHHFYGSTVQEAAQDEAPESAGGAA